MLSLGSLMNELTFGIGIEESCSFFMIVVQLKQPLVIFLGDFLGC